jgi:hypothetical protein
MTRKVLVLAIVAAGAVLAGCSSDSLKRTGYEAANNVSRRQCERDPGAGRDACRTPSYDEYKRSQGR